MEAAWVRFNSERPHLKRYPLASFLAAALHRGAASWCALPPQKAVGVPALFLFWLVREAHNTCSVWSLYHMFYKKAIFFRCGSEKWVINR